MKLSLKSVSGKMHVFSYGEKLRPQRDWFVLLVVAGVLLAISVAWNLWLFSRVTNGELIGDQQAQTPVHGAKLDAMNALFERRAQEETRYLNEYRFVDPSRIAR
jgi:hypothetical protein